MSFQHADDFFASGSRRASRVGDDGRPLHCISKVLDERRIDIAAAAQQMNIGESQARAEACENADLKLSSLYRWQAALKVPASSLLRPCDEAKRPSAALSESTDQLRDRVYSAMRTLRSLQVRLNDEAAHSLSMILAQRLNELLPD